MNGRKKLLCLLMLALFLFSYTTINAFATITDPAAGGGTVQNTAGDNKTNQPGNTAGGTTDAPTGAKTTNNDGGDTKATDQKSVVQTPPATPTTPTTPTTPKKVTKKRYTTVSSSSAASSMVDFFTVTSESSSSEISLPPVGSVSEIDPLASATSTSSTMNKPGIIAWVCIGLGVIVVLIVILSNRRPPHGPGRSRYHRTKRRSGKHLLNDKYYRGLNRY